MSATKNARGAQRPWLRGALALGLLLGAAGPAVGAETAQPQAWKGTIRKSAKDSTPYRIEYAKQAPKGAPNVVWVLLDDVGYGASSAFGGLVRTPTLEKLASRGLRYTNFHTAGICSPTRAALLTGRNHNAVGMGLFPHVSLSGDFPGYHAHLQPRDGTIAEVLRENGYATYQVGKWHLTPDAETRDVGPFDRWPSGKGFDHNFGFLGGMTDQYAPDLVEGNEHVKGDGRHLSEQLADKAIAYLRKQKVAAPEKPFFLYFAPGATHAPHQVDREWSDRYKGRFDAGWDAYRAEVFENQKRLGVVPANATLPARDPGVKPWKDLPPEEQRLFARFMEVYAGFFEHVDAQIGRIVAYLEESGQLENTAIFVVVGDNGGSKEGTEYGAVDLLPFWDEAGLTRAQHRQRILAAYDRIGGRDGSLYANYPLGWAQAANTPFRLWKSDANAEGATHNPLIVHYPKVIREAGLREQFGHVIDLFPTALELAGLRQPETLRGIAQTPLHGTSLAYSIADARAPARHTQQYFNILGNRAIYKDGWKASAAHHPNTTEFLTYLDEPRRLPQNDPDAEVWELYDLRTDFNEQHDLAKQHPERLKELKALFEADAARYGVYPLIDLQYRWHRAKEQPPHARN